MLLYNIFAADIFNIYTYNVYPRWISLFLCPCWQYEIFILY